MENLKEFENLAAFDERNTFWQLPEAQTTEQSIIPLKEWHQQVKSIKLSNRVPGAIQNEFNTARNLAVYAWFCYSFHNSAKTKAFSILEKVLAENYNHGIKIHDNSEFELLLKKLVNENAKGSDILFKEIPTMICKLRISHEQGFELYENSWLLLKVCSQLISEIYDNKI